MSAKAMPQAMPLSAASEGERASNGENDLYYLEQCSLEDDSQDEFNYEAVQDEYENEDSEEDEDFETTMRCLQEGKPSLSPTNEGDQMPALTTRPEVMDDFIRNWLVKMKMDRTLDCFQTEWYELKHKNQIEMEDVGNVPDIYQHNQQLDAMVKSLRRELHACQNTTKKTEEGYEKLKRERDFHRMHHKRVVQEKSKLVSDLRALRKHYGDYEPVLRTLKTKYETAMKEKMLTKLERDRLAGRLEVLESSLKTSEKNNGGANPPRELSGIKEEQKVRDLPLHTPRNPYTEESFDPVNVAQFRVANQIKAHDMAVTSIAVHPSKFIAATVSDDGKWKIWDLETQTAVMSGEGHKDWVADCDFNPAGTHLATVAGDGKVKVWNLKKLNSITFEGHTQAVWGTSFHYSGEWLLSCSMDTTVKLWDIVRQKCRQTFRGHVDAINSVKFQPYTNSFVTGAADKTVSLWDSRQGLCVQTFYGHTNAVSHVAFSRKGDVIASTDLDGVVNIWDVRNVRQMISVPTGDFAASGVVFDPSGSSIVASSHDGRLHVVSLQTAIQAEENKQTLEPITLSSVTGQDEAVNCVTFDQKGENLLSGSADGVVNIWS
eukprot:Nk52_evm21s2039 gene=Nk52_evmTU21s2039